jgi:RHS repeat-associated protein
VRTTYNGGVEGSFTSLPFGDGLTTTGTDNDAYHYGMLDHDSESDTEHAQFRQYSSAQGHWLSPDPYQGSYDFSNPQSLNRYVYAGNNPLSSVDPSGLQAPTVGGYSSNDPNCYSGDVNCGSTWGNAFTGGGNPGLLWNQSAQSEAAWSIAEGFVPSLSIQEGYLMLFLPTDPISQFFPDPFHPGDTLLNVYQEEAWVNLGNAVTMSVPADVWTWSLNQSTPSAGLWHYGRWAGQGGAGLPISNADAGAMMHDYCYAMNGNLTASANFGGFNAALQGCNQALCNTESQIAAQLNQGITTPTTSRGAAAEAYNEEAAAALQMVSYFSLVARFGNGCH